MSRAPYEQAISLAAKGGETERLIAHCGLGEGEANLVRLLCRQSALRDAVR